MNFEFRNWKLPARRSLGTVGQIGNFRNGFTLIEILIYSAILAIFIGAAFAFISSILGTTDTLSERNEVVANQDLVQRKIYWILGRAVGVALPAPNSSSTGLNLNGNDTAVYPAAFAFNNSQITLSLAGKPAVPLTNNRVGAVQFLAENFSNAQTSSTLRISIGFKDLTFPNIQSSTTIFYVFPQN